MQLTMWAPRGRATIACRPPTVGFGDRMRAGDPRGSRKERKSYGISNAREHDCDRGVFFYTSRRFPPVVVRSDDPKDDSGDESDLYEVRIIDNDYNTYQEVMDITMQALGIDPAQAFSVAWEVDHRGYCVVAHASREQAEELANVIRSIGIEVQVNPVSRRSH